MRLGYIQAHIYMQDGIQRRLKRGVLALSFVCHTDRLDRQFPAPADRRRRYPLWGSVETAALPLQPAERLLQGKLASKTPRRGVGLTSPVLQSVQSQGEYTC
jgi:hypothetical protein